jgi:hypothetical protein
MTRKIEPHNDGHDESRLVGGVAVEDNQQVELSLRPQILR